GTEPPPSRYPHISDGTLIPTSQLAVKFPVTPYQPYRLDLTTEPPRVLGTYPALVPQVGADGNEISGIRPPRVTVPIATYTGWNLRDPSVGFPDARQSFTGSFLPFPRNRILEMYRDQAEYLGRYAQEAMKMIDERFLIPEELNATLRAAARDWDYVLGASR
ncbi:MAG TPA: alpha/beta hydrolase domain-containing protein, partial [Thermoanaerobaculia bacterium]